MPLDRGIIDQQLRSLGEGGRWWEQRELRDLPAVLHADEEILAISRGKVARPRWLRRPWLIVVTDKRLVCLRSAGTGSWRHLEVRGDLIARVSLRIGPFRGRVLVVAGGHTYRLLVPRVDGYKLVSALTAIAPARQEAVATFRPTLMARRVIDHVLALPAAALDPATRKEPHQETRTNTGFDEHIESLEGQLDELRKQVEFLEQLLHQQHALPGPRPKLRSD